ncbi:hypothetical protein Mmc1_0644 [Magnetococcus marinus MC-1]|uniref:Uncharacterized protein n=1 Tax=Magnetococcus marinus (strain ATCC BAA-1437 / JCM 17883 / MC-1) TaxID=156889 RepID=A0L5C2_MAGMM|nr:hypothetical protein [Magnetococcus marinus]ABK43165.1 hypothetical protein Mmc1_0644 [Magnetococcus marinus MC-1]
MNQAQLSLIDKLVLWAKPWTGIKQYAAGVAVHLLLFVLYFMLAILVGRVAHMAPLLEPVHIALYYFFGFGQLIFVVPLIRRARREGMKHYILGMLSLTNALIFFNLILYFFVYLKA